MEKNLLRKKEKKGKVSNEGGQEQVQFQKFVREQLLKLKEKGISIPIATL